MFRIRKEQLEHFRSKGLSAYLGRLVAFIEETFPKRFGIATPDELASVARLAAQKAIAMGFTVEVETTQMVLLFLQLGIDADQRLPWFSEIVRDKRLLPIGKARRLVTVAREQGVLGSEALDVSQPEMVI